MIAQGTHFFKYVLFSDESIFKNTEELNTRNCHYWLDVNLYWHRQVDNQHCWIVIVWCGTVNSYLISPHFFHENVNRHNFLESELLRDHLPALLEEVDLERKNVDSTGWCATLCTNHKKFSGSKIQRQMDRTGWFNCMVYPVTRFDFS